MLEVVQVSDPRGASIAKRNRSGEDDVGLGDLRSFEDARRTVVASNRRTIADQFQCGLQQCVTVACGAFPETPSQHLAELAEACMQESVCPGIDRDRESQRDSAIGHALDRRDEQPDEIEPAIPADETMEWDEHFHERRRAGMPTYVPDWSSVLVTVAPAPMMVAS